MAFAAMEVIRNVAQALDIMRRPGNELARDFILATGEDPQGDTVMLANPVALSYAITASVKIVASRDDREKRHPEIGSGEIGKSGESHMNNSTEVVYTMIPGMCFGNIMTGLSIQRVGDPTFSKKVAYSMGRFLRDESTAETLIAITPLGGSVGCPPSQPGSIMYLRHDSSTERHHLYAMSRPNLSFRQLYRDVVSYRIREVANHIIFVESVSQTRSDGCPECGKPFGFGSNCNCILRLSLPRNVMDFSSFKQNHDTHLGEFTSISVVTKREPSSHSASDADTRSAVAGKSPGGCFRRFISPGHDTVASVTDTQISSLLQRLALQDCLQHASPARGLLPLAPTISDVLPSTDNSAVCVRPVSPAACGSAMFDVHSDVMPPLHEDDCNGMEFQMNSQCISDGNSPALNVCNPVASSSALREVSEIPWGAQVYEQEGVSTSDQPRVYDISSASTLLRVPPSRSGSSMDSATASASRGVHVCNGVPAAEPVLESVLDQGSFSVLPDGSGVLLGGESGSNAMARTEPALPSADCFRAEQSSPELFLPTGASAIAGGLLPVLATSNANMRDNSSLLAALEHDTFVGNQEKNDEAPFNPADLVEFDVDALLQGVSAVQSHAECADGQALDSRQAQAAAGASSEVTPTLTSRPPQDVEHESEDGPPRYDLKLSRREKNRLAAARSNARRKKQMDELKSNIASSKETLRQLHEKESNLRKRNMELKESAARLWLEANSSRAQ